MMSDIDILVPRGSLAAVESALMMKGWVSAAQSAYDQRYYRTWMHELPPMRHFKRGTIIDVHHAILPTFARLHPNSEKLLAAARTVGGIKVLAPVDMVLHSATHLFLDSLLSELSGQSDFWPHLVSRAIELDLVRPLFYGLRYTTRMLGTPVPATVLATLARTRGAPTSGLFMAWMDALFLRAFRPTHVTTSDSWTPAARWLLYLRGHWLRMPPRTLVVHLARKLVIRKSKDPRAS
jgi:hypothetical protein